MLTILRNHYTKGSARERLPGRISSASIIGMFINRTHARQEDKAQGAPQFMILTGPERAFFMQGVTAYMGELTAEPDQRRTAQRTGGAPLRRHPRCGFDGTGAGPATSQTASPSNQGIARRPRFGQNRCPLLRSAGRRPEQGGQFPLRPQVVHGIPRGRGPQHSRVRTSTKRIIFSRANNSGNSSKNPGEFGIMEVGKRPHHSNFKRLSSDCYYLDPKPSWHHESSLETGLMVERETINQDCH